MDPEKYALKIVKTKSTASGRGKHMPTVGEGYVECKALRIRVKRETIGRAVYEAKELAREKLLELRDTVSGYERLEVMHALDEIGQGIAEDEWSLEGDEDEYDDEILDLLFAATD